MKVVAFVGPSGTGKSHRAQMVARERNIDYIIDDAILIHKNKVVAGTSAKKAETKIESVKRALFSMPGQVEEIQASSFSFARSFRICSLSTIRVQISANGAYGQLVIPL